MQSNNRTAIMSVILALAVAILACGGGRTTPTAQPENTRAPRATATDEAVVEDPTEAPVAEPTEEPTEAPVEEPTNEPVEEPTDDSGGIVAGEISVTSLYSYLDEYNYFHVVGLIFNNTERPVTSIELTLELADGDGNTVLRDSDDNPEDFTTFSPLLYTLAPGETSPFEYSLSASDQDTSDWQFTVEVTGQSTGEVDRAEMEVVNDQIASDEFGTIYLTGELVNLSDGPVLVNSLAGVLLDDADVAQAADASYSLTRYLAPAGDENGNDRTPFVITLDGPADNATQTSYYWDVDLTDQVDTGSAVTIDITNGFVDTFDRLHVVANVGNNGDEVLSIQLVAGLYADDGTVLDAATASSPIYLGPGEVVPVSFDYFSSVASNADELARVDTYTIQVDPYWTYATSFDVVALESANEASTDEGDGQVTFTGDVVNSSSEDLSSATVVLALYDTDNNLVSSNWTSVYPEGDTFAAGESLPFELTLSLPPDLDTTNYTFLTFVQGYVQ